MKLEKHFLESRATIVVRCVCMRQHHCCPAPTQPNFIGWTMSGECSCSYFMNIDRLQMDFSFVNFISLHIIQIALVMLLIILQHQIRCHEINVKTAPNRQNSHDLCTWPGDWRDFSFRNSFQRPTRTKSLVIAITYPNNNYIMQVMKMSERNWITSIRFATKLVESFSQHTSTFRITNSINASNLLGRANGMFAWTRAQTKWTREKKENENISTSVFVCYLPAMRMHKQLSQRWNSLVLWKFRKWA